MRVRNKNVSLKEHFVLHSHSNVVDGLGMSSLGSNDMRMSWLPPLLPLQTSFWPKTQNGLDVLAPEAENREW